MAISSKVQTVGDFSFIGLQSNHGMRSQDFGIPEERWCQGDILVQLDRFKKANPDKNILSFQIDKWSYRGEKIFITGIYIHHESKPPKHEATDGQREAK
jgi:hypothetical protein